MDPDTAVRKAVRRNSDETILGRVEELGIWRA